MRAALIWMIALNRLGPEGLEELLTRLKLNLFAFSVYQGGFPLYAKLLGAVGGGVAVRGSAGLAGSDELTARMRDFLESLKPEVELAEQQNAYLAIENHGDALLDSLDSFKAFVDLNRSPRLGLALAPYHLQTLGASVEEAISVSGQQLFFFYAWQRATGIAQLPGLGPTRLYSVDCRARKDPIPRLCQSVYARRSPQRRHVSGFGEVA